MYSRSGIWIYVDMLVTSVRTVRYEQREETYEVFDSKEDDRKMDNQTQPNQGDL
jgi:hypothetical protein